MAVPPNQNPTLGQTSEPQIIGDPVFGQPNSGGTSIPSGPQLHDASEGFFDIKPLPEFHPASFSPRTVALVLLAALVLWFLVRHLMKKKPLPAEPTIPPDVRALKALGEIDLQRTRPAAVVRSVAADISLVLRAFIEGTFDFPATDRTRAELADQLPQIVRTKLPILSQDKCKEISNQCLMILRLLERASFADDAERAISPAGEEIGGAISNTRKVVEELTREATREKERQQLAEAQG